MLQENLPLSAVVKITRLTLEEVKGIQASIKKTSPKSVRPAPSKKRVKKK